MEERFERFTFAMLEISRHWHKLSGEEMGKYGLRGTHSVYLLTLAKHPGGLTAAQLCELCGRDKSDVSRMMTIMEEKGLVVKEGTNQNLYRGVFRLTEEGRLAAEQVRRRASRAVELAGRDLSEAQRVALYEALETIVANLRRLSREGIPE